MADFKDTAGPKGSVSIPFVSDGFEQEAQVLLPGSHTVKALGQQECWIVVVGKGAYHGHSFTDGSKILVPASEGVEIEVFEGQTTLLLKKRGMAASIATSTDVSKGVTLMNEFFFFGSLSEPYIKDETLVVHNMAGKIIPVTDIFSLRS